MSRTRGMAGHLGALASMVDNKICCLKDALAEYRNIRNIIDGVTEEKEAWARGEIQAREG
jgi:hypothetical protein